MFIKNSLILILTLIEIILLIYLIYDLREDIAGRDLSLKDTIFTLLFVIFIINNITYLM